jgi:hypothetical protein
MQSPPVHISLTPGREASTEYELCCPEAEFMNVQSLHLTGLYIFSRLFTQDVFCVGHPAEA